MRVLLLALVTASLGVACKRASEPAPDASAPAPSAVPVVAETVPRCRPEGAGLPLPGEDVVVGDVALAPDALLVGLTRREGGKRVASIAKVPLDVKSLKVVDVGPALGDDPPPSPRASGGVAYAVWYARPSGQSTTLQRELRVAKLDALASPLGTVLQQADESFAFDLAWPDDKSAPIVAWDEDAPRKPGALLADRGVVKVQALGAPAASAKVASPETSDAEDPRLVPRKAGGFFLAWLARRAEVVDAGEVAEGPGERRAFRWIEVVALDAKGEPQGAPRRLTPERGRVASFDLVAGQEKDDALVALVVDEAAHTEGAGARLLRVALEGDRVETTELVDGGVARSAAEILAASADSTSRWVAWTDTLERTVVAPASRALLVKASASTETALASARPLAAVPGGLVAVSLPTGTAPAPVELRRFACP